MGSKDRNKQVRKFMKGWTRCISSVSTPPAPHPPLCSSQSVLPKCKSDQVSSPFRKLSSSSPSGCSLKPLSGIPGSLRPEFRTNLPFNPQNKCCSPVFAWDTGAHSPPWSPCGTLLDSKAGHVPPGTQSEVQGGQWFTGQQH